MSELGEAFIMQGIKANMTHSKIGELEGASATWAEVTGKDILEFQ